MLLSMQFQILHFIAFFWLFPEQWFARQSNPISGEGGCCQHGPRLDHLQAGARVGGKATLHIVWLSPSLCASLCRVMSGSLSFLMYEASSGVYCEQMSIKYRENKCQCDLLYNA